MKRLMIFSRNCSSGEKVLFDSALRCGFHLKTLTKLLKQRHVLDACPVVWENFPWNYTLQVSSGTLLPSLDQTREHEEASATSETFSSIPKPDNLLPDNLLQDSVQSSS